MNNRKLFISLVTTMMVTGACSKNHDKNTDEKIQSIVDQTNATNHEQVKKVKADFDKMKNERDDVTKEAERQSSEALERVQKSTLNFVNKMVRVDLLDENDLIERSYLDFFELDPTAGVFKSKFENLFFLHSAGICLNLASLDCETTFDYVTLNLKWGTVGSGRFAMTDEFKEQGARLPGIAFKSFSKVLKLEKDYLILDLSRPQMSENFRFDDQIPSRKIKISLLGGLSKEKHNFVQLTEDKSDRKDVRIVSNDLKKLSRSTVQILVGAEGASSLHGVASGHGTGFFISKDGLLLTNNHVADGLKECMSFHKCKMSLKQVDEENKSTHFTADAELLATDIEMDFALLKIKVPPEIGIESLDIESQEVEASLISLGYPIDEKENRDQIPLVYSFGKLVGTFDLGYTTSIYVAGGASGSAVMNLNNKKVVAIMSNARETSTADKTGPGIARPIQMINSKFNIDDYLNGSKEARVIKILQMLKVSANITEATLALEEFDQERTYLGLGTIKSIMLSHTEISVRKLIMTFLGKWGFITGPQEE